VPRPGPGTHRAQPGGTPVSGPGPRPGRLRDTSHWPRQLLVTVGPGDGQPNGAAIICVIITESPHSDFKFRVSASETVTGIIESDSGRNLKAGPRRPPSPGPAVSQAARMHRPSHNLRVTQNGVTPSLGHMPQEAGLPSDLSHGDSEWREEGPGPEEAHRGTLGPA
jgi:hypothetical protein